MVNEKKRKPVGGPCPIDPAIDVFAGKWKPAILFMLNKQGTLRFNELRKLIPEVTQRMLTRQLRELERDGIIQRKSFDEMPPRVEYSMTKLGASLISIFEAIHEWSNQNMHSVRKAQERFSST